MREWLYGRQAVREMLRAQRRQVRQLIVNRGSEQGGVLGTILALAEARNVPVVEADRNRLDQLSERANHQGVLAEVAAYPYVELDGILDAAQARGEPPFVLCLDHLQDPQNLGTLLRTAEAVGVHGVLIPERRAAGITPAVSNASAGAVEHLLVAEIVNVTRSLEILKARGLWVAGLDLDEKSTPYDQADLRGPLAIVVGSEGEGLSRLVRKQCDWLVSLPMRGRIESLNAAVAGSIVLYAARRAREGKN
jgi:23S rRNA (guanosine2251-2'-O)-methyltransferase